MTTNLKIEAQRVYGSPQPDEGKRFLVDRLWPRGLKKESLSLDAWLKDVAPSNALRKGFHHEPAKWPEFKKRYAKELDEHPEAWRPILEAAQKGKVTLLYGAKEEKYNNAVALMEYLKEKAGVRKK